LERSAAIRKIEQDMIELGRLYQEVAELVHQQEPAVEQIHQGAEDVVQNVTNANTQIDGAISSARKARRWKWYALITISKCTSTGGFTGLMKLTISSPDHCHCRGCCRGCDASQQVCFWRRQIGLTWLWYCFLLF
jgi:hypothetical protein